VGAARAYVEIEAGYCGVSLTPRWLPPRPLPPTAVEPRRATPRSLARLVEKTGSPLAAALAVAAVNAATTAWMLETPGAPPPGYTILRRGDSLPRRLGIESGDRVALLGYMPGLAEETVRMGADLRAADYDAGLLEEARRRRHAAVDARDRAAVAEAIRWATVVVFSGSAVLDPATFLEEARLARRTGARLVALVGATSSFHHLVAEKLGVDAVAGLVVEPSLCPRVRASAAAGGGVHRVRGRLVHWLWRRRLTGQEG